LIYDFKKLPLKHREKLNAMERAKRRRRREEGRRKD